MSVLNNFEVVKGNERRPINKPALVALDVHHTGDLSDATFATQERHILRAQLGVEFWANRAQYESALRTARRVMIQRIYGPILSILPELRHAVHNNDVDYAFALIKRIEEEINE